MKKLTLLALTTLSLSSTEYFVGVENQLSDTKKILYSNQGANYFLDEYSRSALRVTAGLKNSGNYYGLYFEKDYLEADQNFGLGLLFRPELSSQDVNQDVEISYLLDTTLGYSYKDLNEGRFSGSGFLGQLGAGASLNYKNHALSTFLGFEMDYTFTHTEEFAQSRAYLYYGFYWKLGYQYAF